jgi:diguanylate cyclase (GGDEF)-like protein
MLMFLITGVSAFLSAQAQRDGLIEERKMRGMAVLRSWAALSRERIVTGDQTVELSMYDFMDDVMKNEAGVVEIFVQDENGKILMANDPKRAGAPSPDTLFPRLLYAPKSGVFASLKKGDPRFEFYAPIFTEKKKFGVARMVLSSQGIEEGIRESLLRLLFITAIVVGVGMLLVVMLVVKITGPVKLLTKGVEEFGKRFNPALPKTADFQIQFKAANELGDVRDAFNEMTRTLMASLDDRIRLKREATTDGMTGLLNKRQFQEDFPELLRVARETPMPLAMMMLDMDKFKVLNDTVGHKAGDKALQDVAECILKKIRDKDRAYRVGGDEFVILLVGVGVDIARQQSVRIAEMYDHIKLPENMTGISFGIIEYNGIELPEEFYQRADAEMFRVKREKKVQR